MKKKMISSIIAMVTFMLIWVGASLAESPSKSFSLEYYPKELNLTEKQKNALRKNELIYYKELVRHDADLEILMVDLSELESADNPNAEEIKALNDKSGKIMAAMAHARLNAVLQLRSIVTDEQWKKVRFLIDDFIGEPEDDYEMGGLDDFEDDDHDSRRFSWSFSPDDEYDDFNEN